MQHFLKNIIPRIQRYSSDLERIEFFVDKAWIFIDNDGNQHEYIFMRDRRLIMSLNGNVKTGKWEILPNKKLLINRVTDEVLYQNAFIDDALLILQKSGNQEDSFVLININKIPDLNALKYLEDLEEKKLIASEPTERGVIKISASGKIIGNDIYKGAKVKSHDGKIISGVFQVEPLAKNKFIEVHNGNISRVYFVRTYFTFEKKEVKVEEDQFKDLLGSKVLTNLKEVNKEYNVSFTLTDIEKDSYEVRVNEDGVITKAVDIQQRTIVILAIIAVLILFTCLGFYIYFDTL
ncbi:MAG: hypothetical protein HYI21_00350 [Sediminibacterium sp. Gen4]|uniref:hypothetical protein n=1 Tax=unclassified Sediminibacterium TaxID=2635961 RepID=UPI0015B7F177|nr:MULTISPECIES: hypothetical protein [unclassified Sediminibacterium]MBW0161797.1 hypothetical protein [Sediminibacterium sp.]MBW0165002.1 hypothetical protein [Sediminibacterium sp.]NWK64457.1 hypothetical protein [Sediminibacterium sp. Gen4]